ncbi:3444_t:CDS:2, partial [Scutellospora calospora]
MSYDDITIVARSSNKGGIGDTLEARKALLCGLFANIKYKTLCILQEFLDNHLYVVVPYPTVSTESELDVKDTANLWVNKSCVVLQDATNVVISSKCNYTDKTTEICCILLQPFGSVQKHAKDLPLLVQAPLARKLLVVANKEVKYPELEDFIFTCETEKQSDIAIHISSILNSNIQRRFKNSMSEDIMHMPLGLLITSVFESFKEYLGKDLLINLDRNKSDSGSNNKGIRDALLLKGEEKANMDQFDVAASELISKFNVIDPQKFGDIKFMMGYAAAGPLVQFYSIDGSSKKLIPLSDQLNSKLIQDRISLIRMTINIARVIIAIKDIIPV